MGRWVSLAVLRFHGSYKAKVKKGKNGWAVFYYVTANLLAEQDDTEALKLLLEGKRRQNADDKWQAEFGPEPTLWALAWSFGACIMKVDYGYT